VDVNVDVAGGGCAQLLTNCIPPEVIIKELSRALLLKTDASLTQAVAHQAAYYEHRTRTGQKAIFHLEAFVAKFMALYRTWMVSMYSGS
jgi:replication factor C subunit 3/5